MPKPQPCTTTNQAQSNNKKFLTFRQWAIRGQKIRPSHSVSHIGARAPGGRVLAFHSPRYSARPVPGICYCPNRLLRGLPPFPLSFPRGRSFPHFSQLFLTSTHIPENTFQVPYKILHKCNIFINDFIFLSVLSNGRLSFNFQNIFQ